MYEKLGTVHLKKNHFLKHSKMDILKTTTADTLDFSLDATGWVRMTLNYISHNDCVVLEALYCLLSVCPSACRSVKISVPSVTTITRNGILLPGGHVHGTVNHQRCVCLCPGDSCRRKSRWQLRYPHALLLQ